MSAARAPVNPSESNMGLAMSSLYNYVFGGQQYKVVMVGLDNAGKSTILYRLCAGYLLRPRASRASTPGCTHPQASW